MKILVGYDGSESAEIAMKDLVVAGLPVKAEARILMVIPPMASPATMAPESYALQWYPDAYAEAMRNRTRIEALTKKKANLASRRLKKDFPGWKVTLDSCMDTPAHAILKRADDWKPDLIVVGSHGWRFFGKLIVGSVAEKILLHASANVRIGKTLSRKPGAPRILIGFDGSRESKFAVEEVAARRWPKGTTVKLVSVSDFQNRIDLITGTVEAERESKNTFDLPSAWIRNKQAKAKEKLAQPGVEVETAILSGDPRHILLSQAVKFRADTIFLGSRGLTGVKRFMLGSVSAAVASHSPCSIEVIRKPPDWV